MLTSTRISQFFVEKIKHKGLRDFYFRYLRGSYMRLARKIEPGRWESLGARMLSHSQATDQIRGALEEGRPFAAGRIGGIEIRGLHWLLDGAPERRGLDELHNNVGFFPNDPTLFRSVLKAYGESLAALDLLGVWFGKNEGRFYQEFHMSAAICEMAPILLNVEDLAIGQDTSWISSLAGKKVVVISSFAEVIAERANKSAWDKYWAGRVAWPEAKFTALPFPYGQEASTASNYGNSLQLLEELKRQWETVINEADVVLAGCGGYAIPLLAWAKLRGKTAIHLASHVQLLFGIKGARWDNREGALGQLYNEHWVRPPARLVPSVAGQIEQGCYW